MRGCANDMNETVLWGQNKYQEPATTRLAAAYQTRNKSCKPFPQGVLESPVQELLCLCLPGHIFVLSSPQLADAASGLSKSSEAQWSKIAIFLK